MAGRRRNGGAGAIGAAAAAGGGLLRTFGVEVPTPPARDDAAVGGAGSGGRAHADTPHAGGPDGGVSGGGTPGGGAVSSGVPRRGRGRPRKVDAGPAAVSVDLSRADFVSRTKQPFSGDRSQAALRRAMEMSLLADRSLPGFRLERLEVLNWGTFNRRIWVFPLGGRNGLLVGDNGSGKSTLVDALTTLFVPDRKAQYNRAGGAEKRERTLASYVYGHHRTERDEDTGRTRRTSLRGDSSYTVVLGVFTNAWQRVSVTLAAVFWPRGEGERPLAMYVCANRDLSIAKDFSNFGTDMDALRRRLRGNGAEVFSAFREYASWYRIRFSMENEQAVNLFHQTVSMKNIESITPFVRGYMLEPFPVQEKIDALVANYDTLLGIYANVLRARDQLALLGPLVEEADRHDRLEEDAGTLTLAREAVRPYVATLRVPLLEEALQKLETDLAALRLECGRKDAELSALDEERAALRVQMAEKGGNRVAELRRVIAEGRRELDRRRAELGRFHELLDAVGEELAPATSGQASGQSEEVRVLTAADFARIRARLSPLRERFAAEETALKERSDNFLREMAAVEPELARLREEIADLRTRRGNIDSAHARMREGICQALGVPVETLPFAGEVVRVKEEEDGWKPAVERLARGFGLTLLVPAHLFAKVVAHVEENDLGGRLAFCRVDDGARLPSASLPGPDSVARRLEVKEDCAHRAFLEREINRRFDHVCVDGVEGLLFGAEDGAGASPADASDGSAGGLPPAEGLIPVDGPIQAEGARPRALTRTGQVRDRDGHVKDDSRPLGDAASNVLGWENVEKIRSLAAEVERLGRRRRTLENSRREVEAQMRTAGDRLRAVEALERQQDYEAVDTVSAADKLKRLEEELASLLSSSNVLATLRAGLEALEARMAEGRAARDAMGRDVGRLEGRVDACRADLDACRKEAESASEACRGAYQRLERPLRDALRASGRTVESLVDRVEGSRCEKELDRSLERRMRDTGNRLGILEASMIQKMREFKQNWPAETQDVDANLASLDEFRRRHEALVRHDLPGQEKKLKEFFSTQTIRGMVDFSTELDREVAKIRRSVETINSRLREMDYNPGRYIELECAPTADRQVRRFVQDLRACFQNSIMGEGYSEEKMLHIRDLLERLSLRNLEGTDSGEAWKEKVVDVRNRFDFSIVERVRETGEVHEVYEDSGGKSGGQKEKLAYTVLAAALVYQYGLKWQEENSPSFRFAVIDEAFEHGSRQSAEYVLRLFDKLNLQLLLITPTQKVDVIAPFVSTVGIVANPTGDESTLCVMDIETFRRKRAMSLTGAPAVPTAGTDSGRESEAREATRTGESARAGETVPAGEGEAASDREESQMAGESTDAVEPPEAEAVLGTPESLGAVKSTRGAEIPTQAEFPGTTASVGEVEASATDGPITPAVATPEASVADAREGDEFPSPGDGSVERGAAPVVTAAKGGPERGDAPGETGAASEGDATGGGDRADVRADIRAEDRSEGE